MAGFYYRFHDGDCWQNGGDSDVSMVFNDLVNAGSYVFSADGSRLHRTDDDDYEHDEWGDVETCVDGQAKLIDKSETYLWDVVINGDRPDLKEIFDSAENEFVKWAETARNGDTFDFLGIEITCESDEDEPMDISGGLLDKPRMGRPTLYGETMRNIMLGMTDKQNRWLINEAKKRGISKSQLVRDLVDKEIKAKGQQAD